MSETVPKITPTCLSNSHLPDLGTSLHAYIWRDDAGQVVAKSSIYLELDEARTMPGADPLMPPQVRAARAVTFVYSQGGRFQMVSDFADPTAPNTMLGGGAFRHSQAGSHDILMLKPLDEALFCLGSEIAGVVYGGQVEPIRRVHDDIPIEDGPTAPWCVNHQVTKENLAGTDCIALMGEGRVFKCPYKNLAAAKCAEFPCPEAKEKGS